MRLAVNYRAQACRGERNLYSGGAAGLTAYAACVETLTRHWISDLKAAYWWRVEKFGS
ncbi:hypothetical protein GCM10007868_24540 [Gluconobacter frateurii]|uniref:Transposase n=1 Tax=Gluconobacter frateurii NRIC 0228 TaxID=1307946 RepID=A0ABQ0Q780_9PROT|nr:hypothetical protein AA0228_0055 [Gluconobacter frateurii NRIC 0228]GLP91379.1 hypothetical protein GCM10007868_24540 [Gluconobacter frateurii]